MEPCPAPAGCQHCLACLPCALTYELCDRTRRQQPEPYIPWWPASIDSPTLYYQLKRRAQAHQFREQARSGFSDPSVWRCQASSAAAGCGSQLLAARGARQLAVRLPTARTNIAAADELEFVGICNLQAPAPVQQQQQAAVPQLPAASPMDVQQQQPKQQAVVRPRARRASPPLPPAAPAQQQQPAVCPPLHAQHLNLLASLQYQEQCHRQQLAAALPAATAWAAPSYQAAHTASYLRPAPTSWQCAWDGMLLQQQQQQQAQLQCQQAAAAAVAAAWPFAVPEQQQGGWAFGASVPLPALTPLQLSTTALTAC